MGNDSAIAQAAQALVSKLRAIHADPAYIGVWSVAQTHCGRYTGPNYIAELAALESALGDATQPAASACAECESGTCDMDDTRSESAADWFQPAAG